MDNLRYKDKKYLFGIKKKLTKKESELIHFKRRLNKRYGIYGNKKVRLEIMKQIRGNNSTIKDRTSVNRSLHNVFVYGKKITVVYDKRRKSLVTCF
jgi:hypothetical protein